MAEFMHTGRVSLIDREVSWNLSIDGLVASTGSKSETIPYANIRGLRLITFPGSGGAQHRAILTTNSHVTHKIASHHYVSLGNFEDHSSSYASLIPELALRIDAANPRAQFTAGSLGLWFAWLIVCLLVLGLAVLIVFVALEAVHPLAPLVGAVIMVGTAGPFAIHWAIRNLPKSFHPKSISTDLLGKRR